MDSVDVASMYIRVDELIADLHNQGKIQELSVLELRDEESTRGSVPPSLCRRGSDLSSDDHSALASELSKFTVSGSTTAVDTAELTDISIEELEDDVVSYTNQGNEVDIDSPNKFVGLSDCYLEPSSIVAEEKAENEAAAIKNWKSKFSQDFSDLQSLDSPNEVVFFSVPPVIAIVGK